MPLLTPETWAQFQAEGRRPFLRRRTKRGLALGLAVALAQSFLVAIFATRHRAQLPAVVLLIIVGETSAMALGYFLLYSFLWELLRRKFSRK